jgi:hypothetical protein
MDESMSTQTTQASGNIERIRITAELMRDGILKTTISMADITTSVLVSNSQSQSECAPYSY